MARRSALVLLVTTALYAGCSGGSGGGAGLRVVATTPQVADLVSAVAGNRVRLHQVVGPGRDPHDYEPRPSDARAIADAQLVFRSGGDVDEWLGGLLRQAGGGARTVTLLRAVGAENGDPHWWQDPHRAERAVGAIRGALSAADPKGAPVYARRAGMYLVRLRRLDRAIRACVRRVPHSQRRIVTTHDALGYFARRYGIDVAGTLIPARTTEAQPSARDLRRLVQLMRRERVAAVFPERGLDQRLERAVAREAGARMGKTLFADSLGAPGSAGATYLQAMAHDADALVEGMSRGSLRCR